MRSIPLIARPTLKLTMRRPGWGESPDFASSTGYVSASIRAPVGTWPAGARSRRSDPGQPVATAMTMNVA
ncbi:hypothetical protein Sxan_04030 [Streptomyces xanthophaeus]|uniref:Uncharacterized protein n=1 Tax=Streptomyces xanthophaeus TaxID=67385 RepID=A0A919GSZ7_9ACTN|nr:hypothetical protein Sxan_04030 [Streptomyces xanthophaeus]